MAEVGNRVAVTSKASTREGVVLSVSGSLIRVRWDTGEETSLVPGPGSLTVLARGRRARPSSAAPTKRSASAKRQAGTKVAAKKAASGTKKGLSAKKTATTPRSSKKKAKAPASAKRAAPARGAAKAKKKRK